MVAYLHKARSGTGFNLTLCDRPCNGEEFQAGRRIWVASKAEARRVCKCWNAKPWNF